MSFAWRKKEGNLRSVCPNRSVDGHENKREPVPPSVPPQVPASRVAANFSWMNSNRPARNTDVGLYLLLIVRGFQRDLFDSVFHF